MLFIKDTHYPPGSDPFGLDEQGRKLLAEGYQTYVVNDAELARIRSGYKNLWDDKNGKPTHAHIG